MGEVSEILDVKPSVIRFWEGQFSILRPKKNAKGNRMFTVADLENLKVIYHLVRERGMTLKGADKYLKANRKQIDKNAKVVERLHRVRAMLLEIKQELEDPQPASATQDASEEASLPFYPQQLFDVEPITAAPAQPANSAPQTESAAGNASENALPTAPEAPVPAAKPAGVIEQTLF